MIDTYIKCIEIVFYFYHGILCEHESNARGRYFPDFEIMEFFYRNLILFLMIVPDFEIVNISIISFKEK